MISTHPKRGYPFTFLALYPNDNVKLVIFFCFQFDWILFSAVGMPLLAQSAHLCAPIWMMPSLAHWRRFMPPFTPKSLSSPCSRNGRRRQDAGCVAPAWAWWSGWWTNRWAPLFEGGEAAGVKPTRSSYILRLEPLLTHEFTHCSTDGRYLLRRETPNLTLFHDIPVLSVNYI